MSDEFIKLHNVRMILYETWTKTWTIWDMYDEPKKEEIK